MPELELTSYPCPLHGHDLTDPVREALEGDGYPTAYPGRHVLGRRPGWEEFRVFVDCPGGTPPDGAHRQSVSGKFRK